MLLLGSIAIVLLMGIIILAQKIGIVYAHNPQEQLVGAPEGYHQKTLIAQIAEAVFSGFPIGSSSWRSSRH